MAVRLDARDYLNHLKSSGQILYLAHYSGETCDGRGHGLIINRDDGIAVMLTDCGNTEISAGDLVNFIEHPEAEPKIVGSGASFRDR